MAYFVAFFIVCRSDKGGEVKVMDGRGIVFLSITSSKKSLVSFVIGQKKLS